MGRTEACPVPEGKVAGTATDAVRQNSIAAAVGPMNQRTIYTPALPQFKYCVSDDIAFAFKNVDTSQCVGSVSVSQNLRYGTCVAFHRSPFRQRVSFQTRKQLRQPGGPASLLGMNPPDQLMDNQVVLSVFSYLLKGTRLPDACR